MTTKAQERKALEQIRKIVESLGENSYIGMAFEGCFEIAEENIENDFGLSMKQRMDNAEFAEDQLREKVAVLTDKIESHKKAMELAEQNMLLEKERAQNLARNLLDMKAIADQQEQEKLTAIGQLHAMEDMMEEKENEIIKLKAKLYDLMTK